MSSSWAEPVAVLIGRVPIDLSGVWSLLFAAESAALRLGAVPGQPDPQAFAAGLSLREAVEELEWFYPDVVDRSAAVELGPVPGEEPGRVVVVALLDAVIGRVSALVADPLLSGDDVLMLARVVGSVVDARTLLSVPVAG